MNTYQIIVTDEATGKEVVYTFDDYRAFLGKFNEIKQGYVIIQEHTVARLNVERKADLFGDI